MLKNHCDGIQPDHAMGNFR